jgi:hypothetical protein
MNALQLEGLTITPSMSAGKLRVTMAGAVEMRDPGEMLNPYWTSIDDEARRAGVAEVQLDLRDLGFMNSSGILTLVRWITKLKNAPAYKLTLLYDRNVTWQRTSVPTLAKLASNVVTPQEING